MIVTLLTFTGCGQQSAFDSNMDDSVSTSTANELNEPVTMGTVYLYGESHGNAKIMAKELALWKSYYNEKGMRHLFIEYPYYEAELLNIWMKEKDNKILEDFYSALDGTAAYTPDTLKFYKEIKATCPETIFHGTDVGHRYEATGYRYLSYLEEHQLEESENYKRAEEVIEQGRIYYKDNDDVYRENKMAENFIWAFKQLNDEDIMGIYGVAHTGLESLNYSGKVPCMANQLTKLLGTEIFSEDISSYALMSEPIRVDTLKINGKAYKASYFGKEEFNDAQKFKWRETWRVENAYEVFKNAELSNDMVPYYNYPMQIQEGQVFIVDIMTPEGKVERYYYRSDGEKWENQPATTGFKLN